MLDLKKCTESVHAHIMTQFHRNMVSVREAEPDWTRQCGAKWHEVMFLILDEKELADGEAAAIEFDKKHLCPAAHCLADAMMGCLSNSFEPMHHMVVSFPDYHISEDYYKVACGGEMAVVTKEGLTVRGRFFIRDTEERGPHPAFAFDTIYDYDD